MPSRNWNHIHAKGITKLKDNGSIEKDGQICAAKKIQDVHMIESGVTVQRSILVHARVSRKPQVKSSPKVGDEPGYLEALEHPEPLLNGGGYRSVDAADDLLRKNDGPFDHRMV